MTGIDKLQEHATGCDACKEAPLPLSEIAAALDASVSTIDASSLSRRVLAEAQPLLQRVVMRRFWRQVAAVIVVALTPLPFVLAYDAYLLQLLHTAVSTLLPSALATYFVASYAASLLFLFALSYAAIPVLMARSALPRLVPNG